MTQQEKNAGKANPGEPKRRRGRPPLPGPSARQQEMLDFIRSADRSGGRPPSIEEIRRHFHFSSTNAVRTHLAALEKKGLLKRVPNSHRGISLTSETRDAHGDARFVPLLGDAPAGAPGEAIIQADEHIALDPALFPQTDLFAIRVRGHSMTGAGINDRDLALIRPAAEAHDGDLVLARVNNEVTIKRLRFKRAVPCLHPENPEYPDIIPLENDEFSIIGIVAGIIRKY